MNAAILAMSVLSVAPPRSTPWQSGGRTSTVRPGRHAGGRSDAGGRDSEATRARIEALRSEAAKLRLLLARLVSPEISTTDRLREEVVAHLQEQDREKFVSRLKIAADGIGPRLRGQAIDMRDVLQLSPEQQDRIRAILAQFETDFKAAAIAATLDQPVEASMDKLFADVEVQIRAQLSEEQAKRWRGLPRGLMTARKPRN